MMPSPEKEVGPNDDSLKKIYQERGGMVGEAVGKSPDDEMQKSVKSVDDFYRMTMSLFDETPDETPEDEQGKEPGTPNETSEGEQGKEPETPAGEETPDGTHNETPEDEKEDESGTPGETPEGEQGKEPETPAGESPRVEVEIESTAPETGSPENKNNSSEDKKNETEKRAKRHLPLKRVLAGVAIATVAGIVTIAAFLAGKSQNKKSISPESQKIEEGFHGGDEEESLSEITRRIHENNQEANGATEMNEADDTVAEVSESEIGLEKLNSLLDGSFEQDGNIGCYDDSNKVSDTAIGNPEAVCEYLGLDYSKLTPAERSKISEYITGSMKYPFAAMARSHMLPGFEGLSQLEAEQKVAGMSVEEKAAAWGELSKDYARSTYHYEIGKGMMENHGVVEDEVGRHSVSREDDLTGKKILVRTTVKADGTVITDRIKEDCENWLYTIVEAPNGQISVFAPKESAPVEDTLVSNDPSTPERSTPDVKKTSEKIDNPESQPETPNSHIPKNVGAERAYAGYTQPMGVDMNQITPESEYKEQQYANYTDVAQQAMEDAAREAEAARVATEQAAAEQAAASYVAENPVVVDATPEQISSAINVEQAASDNAAPIQAEANEIAQAGVAEAEQGSAADAAAKDAAENVAAEMGSDDNVTVDDFINGYLGDY